jgi:DNA-binding LacI/PurR family transcriptional regulator
MDNDQPIRRRATASDVARAAGTSQSAVSRTFTAGASVSPELRERIMKAALRLGYRPNAIARSLITRKSHIIAVTIAYLNNQFYPNFLEALSERMQDRGYQILLFTAQHGSTADPLFEQIMRHQVEAVILASTMLSSALASECRLAGVPVVMFNRATDDDDVSSVTGDNERGGRAIAEFLIRGGHKRLAYIAGIEESSTSRDREYGFRKAIQAAGLDEPLRAVGHYTSRGAEDATRALLGRSDPPDAIFCANDHMAIACLEVARHEFKRSVPQDLSIVGFDDVGPAKWPSYDLTTYSQPLTPMVDATVGIVDDFIRNPDQPVRRIVVAGQLVVRGSARRPL